MDEPNTFNDLMKCAASIKSAQLAELRRNYDKQPAFVQSGLYMHERLKDIHAQNTADQLLYSEKLRAEGKEEFKNGKYDESLYKFEEALCVFRYIIPSNEKWKKEPIEDSKLTYIDFTGNNEEEKLKIKEAKIFCYLNIAACHLKSNNSKIAMDACNETLKLDPKNVKALYS